MSSSRATFKTMFLVSEDYLKEMQNRDQVVASTTTTTVPTTQTESITLPPTPPSPPLQPSPVVPPVQPLQFQQDDDDEEMRELDSWSPPTTVDQQMMPNVDNKSLITTPTTTVNNKNGTAMLTTPITESMQIKDIEEKRSICPICNAEFAAKEDMLKHVKSRHKKKRAFTCRLCNKEFATDTWLNRHIRDTHLSSQEWRSGKKVNPMVNSLLQRRKRLRDDDDDGDDDDDDDSELTVKKIKEDMSTTKRQLQKRKRMQNDPRDELEMEAKRLREDDTSRSQDLENLIKCKECNKIFDSFKELRQHQLTTHSGGRRVNY